MRGLEQRIALVTGATGLIGRAIVLRLAEEGATVVIASRQAEKARSFIQTVSPGIACRLVPLELNLGSEESIQAGFDWMGEHVGIPAILIANASLREELAHPFDQLAHSQFSHLMEVDIAGHFLCARHIVEHHPAGTSMSVVFLSSIYAEAGVDLSIYLEGMSPAPPQYAAVKAASLGMTRYLAGLWGDRGVRVNAVVAGGVRSAERQKEEFAANYSRKTMLRRMAAPEEIASAVVFLASEDASYITGTFLNVDGGFLAW